ncbi:hypothetical protein C8J45_103321 [Sphingomonas sp. PP-CE-3G-477]|uniref:hypothetical protein n=1 Tax=Sphingomonas sp. PP-CE-3G-477 TaxID=2135660 RepID=UPI000D42FF71|nr:hypothetical protein [Sphingomonas sp. PP-CE-3G-477]PTQ64471.1 hypothetical protein C8J45_103321 [Sphingomonas sp. PP-CE-3G-477]
MSGPHREVYRSRDGKTSISTNIDGFKWPTPAEKIAGLLSAGLIDQAEADRLTARLATSRSQHEGASS